MDVSALAKRDFLWLDNGFERASRIPPKLVYYFCDMDESLIVDFGDALKPYFNSKAVVANISEVPRYLTGGFGNDGEYFVSDDGDIAKSLTRSQRLVPADGIIPCGPGVPKWHWRFQNGTNDHCTFSAFLFCRMTQSSNYRLRAQIVKTHANGKNHLNLIFLLEES